MMKTKRFTPNASWFIRQGRIRPDCEFGQQDAPRLTASPSQNTNRKSEQGIALVITLILLSVTLVMAVAFLAVSRRERGSVTTTQDTATAKFAADAALARAEARIVSQILTTTNPYVFSLYVSTNYINRYGFNPDDDNNLTNVNYDYLIPTAGGPLAQKDFLQNIANLYYNPRPPVFYSNDFRFYLDLNRNGKYDTNGWVANQDNFGTTNGFGTYSFQVGDPEWIGVLEHPDQPHGPNNPFIARYCFIAVPANSLDLNYIHNQALNPAENTVNAPSVGADGYSRDEGVGSWEINLAAFLADLNTNRWNPPSPGPSFLYPEGAVAVNGFGKSIAFDDARALVAWRYNNFYPLLANANSLFGGLGSWGDFAFRNNGIDYYSLGQQYTFDTNFFGYGNPGATPWLGAPQTNSYFSSPSELFNVSRSDLDFVTNLYSAGTNLSTYDRYTFYRLLAQLGTDTQPSVGKINLNYQNAIINYDFPDLRNFGSSATNVPLNITVVPNMETNFQSWSPHDFFTAAADRLLRAYTTEWFEESPSNYIQTYYGITGYSYTNLDAMNVTNIQYLGQTNQIPSFGITNIPVYMNGSYVYTPAVNRLLQLAANIYDASTNTEVGALGISNYPSVFRPVFYKAVEKNYFLNQIFTNIYIKGFQYVPEPLTLSMENSILTMPVEATDLPFGYSMATNAWGVPWIIGAKKGLPNFNGLEVDSTFFIERLLQYNRSSSAVAPTGSPFPFGRIYTTNQMYIMGVSNVFTMDDWNSYADSYANQITIVARDTFGFGLTNDAVGYRPVTTTFFTNGLAQPPSWPGYGVSQTASFEMPFGSNVCIMQNLSSPIAASPPSTNNLYVYFDGTAFPSTNINGITYTAPCFIPTSMDPANYMGFGTPPLPQFGMQTTNRLQAYMLDTKNPNAPYILDYVQLGGMNNSLNVNQAIADPDSTATQYGTPGLWSTNAYAGGGTPWGVVEQYSVSSGGTFPTVDGDEGNGTQLGWKTSPIPGLGNLNSVAAQQAYFEAFFTPGNAVSDSADGGIPVSNIALSVQAPFTPMRQIVQRYVYQANDPLIHYLTQDLYDFQDSTNGRYNLSLPPPAPKYVGYGIVSDRYMPWGAAGNLAGGTINNVPADNNPDNLSYKDPLVTASDYWDFPTNKYPTVGWLGRVHRGTPWQTVYMKSPDILFQTETAGNNQLLNVGVPTWQLWTGNAFNAYDAGNTAPDQDRLLFDLFTAAPDDDATRGQLSVNIGADDPTQDPLDGLASWSALLSGIVVFTNNQSDFTVGFQSPNPPYFALWTNQPLGIPPYPGGYMTNAAMWQVVAGINSARTNYGAYPNPDGLTGVFEHAGDILRVPQLSVASPYLNNDTAQQPIAINDEMYEWLPQQIMGLVTASGAPQNPPRYVVYCYGQTLKPAPNGLVSSGQFFGMCTNYQVTAESAARVVIEVQNPPTPANPNATPHVVVKQYNALPPD